MYKKLQVFNIHNLMSSDMNTYSHDTITIIKITNVSITSKKKRKRLWKYVHFSNKSVPLSAD